MSNALYVTIAFQSTCSDAIYLHFAMWNQWFGRKASSLESLSWSMLNPYERLSDHSYTGKWWFVHSSTVCADTISIG